MLTENPRFSAPLLGKQVFQVFYQADRLFVFISASASVMHARVFQNGDQQFNVALRVSRERYHIPLVKIRANVDASMVYWQTIVQQRRYYFFRKIMTTFEVFYAY
jgi:hypothetical protein